MPQNQTPKQRELIRRVAERVWQLLLEDLRRERERRGANHARNR